MNMQNDNSKNVFVANFLDPLEGISVMEMMEGKEGKGICYKEKIVAETDEQYEYYSSKADKDTNELYFMIVYKSGKAETYCCDKATFYNAYERLKNI